MSRDEAQDPQLERLLQTAGSRPVPSAERAARVRAATHDAWLGATASRRRRRLWTTTAALATAAAIAMAVFLARRPAVEPAVDGPVATLMTAAGPVVTRSMSAMRPDTPVARGFSAVAGTKFVTLANGRATFRLASGTDLRLDVDTQVRIASATRIELIRGAVFVDTGDSPTAAAGVVVSTPLGEAHDIGTRFEVRLLDEAVRIRVREGSVRLERPGRVHTAGAGRELMASAAGAVTESPFAASDPAWGWTALATTPPEIEGRTLDAFIAWIEEEGGWRVRFASDGLARSSGSIVLHGSIAGLTPHEALDTILPACGLTYRLTPATVMIAAVSARVP